MVMRFPNPFRKSPELRKAIEAEQEQIRAAGDSILARIEADKQARIKALDEEHGKKMEVLEGQIADKRRELDDMRQHMLLDSIYSSLQFSLGGALTSALARSNVDDSRAAVTSVRNEIEERMAHMKKNLNAQAVSDMEEWALSKVEGNIRGEEKISEAFAEFRRKLAEQSIPLAEA